MRLLSIALMAAGVLLDFIVGTDFLLMPALCLDILSGCSMLLIYPPSGGDSRRALAVGSSVAAAYVTFRIIRLPYCVTLVLVQLTSSISVLSDTLVRFRSSRYPVQRTTAWEPVELSSRIMYLAFWILMGELVCLLRLFALCWIMLLPCSAIYLALYCRSYFALSLVLPPTMDREFKKCILHIQIPGLKTLSGEQDRMKTVYDRVLSVMETSRPYLGDYSLSSLSKDVYCNRSYLSRTINLMTGMTFCKFVNSYRIPYARQLLEKNPRMRMKDVAAMSGFQNIVTFNVSFKEVTGQTPSEYADKLKAGLLQSLSSWKGQEL